MVAKRAEIEKPINPAQPMILQHVIVEIEGIKQPFLTILLLSHHRRHSITVGSEIKSSSSAEGPGVFKQNRLLGDVG